MLEVFEKIIARVSANVLRTAPNNRAGLRKLLRMHGTRAERKEMFGSFGVGLLNWRQRKAKARAEYQATRPSTIARKAHQEAIRVALRKAREEGGAS